MLTLIKKRVKLQGNHHWYDLYLCDCGKEHVARRSHVTAGNVSSCGCKKGNHKHGMDSSREHKSWSHMLYRCRTATAAKYKDYGGRGITVCKEWEDFSNFYRDMGPRPPNTSIDRINNDLGYFKENCRWADPKTQTNNRRVSKKPASSDRQPEPVSVVLQSSE